MFQSSLCHVKGLNANETMARLAKLQVQCGDGALNTDFTNYDSAQNASTLMFEAVMLQQAVGDKTAKEWGEYQQQLHATCGDYRVSFLFQRPSGTSFTALTNWAINMATAHLACMRYLYSTQTSFKRAMKKLLESDNGLKELDELIRNNGIHMLAEGDDFTCTYKDERLA